MSEPYCYDESHRRVMVNVKGKDALCLGGGGGSNQHYMDCLELT